MNRETLISRGKDVRMTPYREKSPGDGLDTFIEGILKKIIAGKLWNVSDKAACSIFNSSKHDLSVYAAGQKWEQTLHLCSLKRNEECWGEDLISYKALNWLLIFWVRFVFLNQNVHLLRTWNVSSYMWFTS